MVKYCMDIPRKVQKKIFHTLTFLKRKQNSDIVFDSFEPEINDKLSRNHDCSDTVYGYLPEDIPPEHQSYGGNLVSRREP